jgi:hypothetical protein
VDDGVHWLSILAEGGTTTPINVGGDWGIVVTLFQTGLVGVVLVCILTGKLLVPKYISDRERKALETQIQEAADTLETRLKEQMTLLTKQVDDQRVYYEARLNDAKNAHAEAITNRDTTIIEEKTKNERYSRLIEERVVPTLVQANQLAANYAEDMRRARGHDA